MSDQPKPRIRFRRLTDDLPDAAKPPDVVLIERTAQITIEAAEKTLQDAVGRLVLDRLSFGCLVTALKRDVAWPKKPTWPMLAIAIGLCERHTSKAAKKQAGQKVRNAASFARRFYRCAPGHNHCPGPCALEEGRRIFGRLKEECRGSVSPDDFRSALDVLEK